jgi:hypothetical protein
MGWEMIYLLLGKARKVIAFQTLLPKTYRNVLNKSDYTLGVKCNAGKPASGVTRIGGLHCKMVARTIVGWVSRQLKPVSLYLWRSQIHRIISVCSEHKCRTGISGSFVPHLQCNRAGIDSPRSKCYTPLVIPSYSAEP